jgi:DNA polymerase-1
MDKIYIVDAVNYLFRSYYAIGPMLNDKGQSTSALYGFIRSVQKLMKDFSPGYFVAVFDGPDNKKSRQAVYAEYKSHRVGAPEDLFPQFEWASDWCKMAGIPTLCVEGVEADDTMASVAIWAAKKGASAYLCSSDKDLCQLVNEKTFMLHAHKNNLLVDEARVVELFGVRPNQMLDYLAIVGDASDNIPGIPGFGPKTAVALLEEFGTLDALLKHPEKVKGEKKQEILREHEKTALMSRQLATLDMAVEIPRETEFYRLKERDLRGLSEFYHRMKFLSLIREMEETPQIKQQYHLVDEEEGVRALFAKLNQYSEICIDTETTDAAPMKAELVGVSFCVEPGEAWYVPCNGKLGAKAVSLLQEFFLNTSVGVYGHNIKYDWHVLKNVGISLDKISFDTLVASYLLNPQSRRHNLDDLTLETFQKKKIPIQDLIGKGKEQISMREVEVAKVAEYACEDADYTARLKELFVRKLEEKGLSSLFFDIEMPLLPILANMERVGVFLDVEKLREIGHDLTRELDALTKKIYGEVGEEFNLNSPKQLSEILFTKLGMRQPRAKKTEFSTGADVLEALAPDYPVARLVLEYRGLEKLRSTYVEALPEAVLPRTGRIHCTFSQSVAATGRLSCQDPNLQNIPVRSKEGRAIRECFRPERSDWVWIGGDYSQIELRILAHFSEDPELLHAFKTGRDVHTHTASLIYEIPVEMVTEQMRDAAKTVNFGIIYGQGPFGLSKQLGISSKQASEFIEKYFERYPRVAAYLESCKEAARKTGVSTTLTGRTRPIPEIHNQNPQVRAAAERLAVNTPLQGTAADLIKLAMIEIDREISRQGLEGSMILQIHDELIFEVPEREMARFQGLVKEKMEQVWRLKVPIEVHLAVGKNWAEC